MSHFYKLILININYYQYIINIQSLIEKQTYGRLPVYRLHYLAWLESQRGLSLLQGERLQGGPEEV